jgi:hypothetical protein
MGVVWHQRNLGSSWDSPFLQLGMPLQLLFERVLWLPMNVPVILLVQLWFSQGRGGFD